jgi:hypothetical protein
MKYGKTKYRVEMIVEQEKFDIPANKSKSMINALEREQIENMVGSTLGSIFDGVQVMTVRKIHQEGTCT